ncbi:NitT/TauT family transport system ATP-binding protein [Paraburkholderia caballeronis]|uniref:NitT/TauT family transport system ATP-binding protein n=2 Tax=Paraburkholderia caballeronis TaxID=416943 RepID=A0A1H7SZE9_9BURK|nr:NitT/TauT family transport system ATP-binding protein [Paraburkholderia caballeronis]PXX01364.1 NitT/TauT family transport system ATP-binding protein [Paraburkholderia caballeronis]RAJ99282.1 NitT/TauT family transport system ATP-binding protein [Paraburkholderia caballeronis]SEE23768.1 NitT/TauT family transport system ATP-binding protein [Paraburkholderia caballeronis]SEL77973.1 NitT/TauT family transport system ATP-binding protein [Paraburkholderia caballeronis]
MNPKISINGLRKEFHTGHAPVVALERCNLDVQEGEFICIVGPSGCGKTTLLRILAGLETPSEGNVTVRQTDPTKPLATMMFQETSVFPWMNVRANVAYGLRLRGVDPAQTESKVNHFLSLTGLERFANAYPHQLSGGMKQRVSVARAFANDPEILLMDEPFAALDEQNKIVLQEELLRLWSETRKTVLFITHSIDEALVLSDRVIVMSGRPARLKADLRINFPRPRAVYDLKDNPEYASLSREIWMMLREEVVGK